MKKYFMNCQTLEKLKKEYKSLAMKYHPDINPNGLEIMQEINAEYEQMFELLKDTKSTEKSLDFIQIIEKLLEFSNIDIEVIGSWIWLHGSTYEIKEELKDLGFQWSKGKKKWYFNPNGNGKKYRYKQKSMESLRSAYGSEYIKNSNQVKALR